MPEVPPLVPARRRPRDRREQILRMASSLFVARGFGRTAMGDIAEAVGITPSALYRHFSSKHELLFDVVTAGVRPIVDAFDTLEHAPLDVALLALASVALDEHHAGVLWQRESRHMRAEHVASVQADLARARAKAGEWIRQLRPDVDEARADALARSVMAVLVSPSFHRIELSRTRYEELLVPLLRTVVSSDLPGAAIAHEGATRHGSLLPASRREALLLVATQMFADAGFENVSMDDIARAMGMAGPSIYGHFSTKTDMLSASFARVTQTLFSHVAAAYRGGGDDPERTLWIIADSYIGFSWAHDDFIGILITESRHLPDDSRDAALRAQRDYLGEWRHLLRTARPGLSAVEAQVRVDTAVDLINELARVPHLRADERFADALARLVRRLLIGSTSA